MSEADTFFATDPVMVTVQVVCWIALYMAPTIVAVCRKHRQAGAIAALNFFLGVTIIGWIGALICR